MSLAVTEGKIGRPIQGLFWCRRGSDSVIGPTIHSSFAVRRGHLLAAAVSTRSGRFSRRDEASR